MKKSELKELSIVELASKARDLRQELFNLKLQKATSQLERPHRLKEIRRDIARVETRISEMQRQPVGA